MMVRYTLRAYLERERIFDYIELRSPQGARSVQRAVLRAIRSLSVLPRSGHAIEFNDVREKSVPRYPYKVYYRIETSVVWIVHIRHTARAEWKKE
jgi:plasmid stabilization system protein ParE